MNQMDPVHFTRKAKTIREIETRKKRGERREEIKEERENEPLARREACIAWAERSAHQDWGESWKKELDRSSSSRDCTETLADLSFTSQLSFVVRREKDGERKNGEILEWKWEKERREKERATVVVEVPIWKTLAFHPSPLLFFIFFIFYFPLFLLVNNCDFNCYFDNFRFFFRLWFSN